MIRALSTTVAALAIAAFGGAIFFLIHAPLPWTLGALSAAGMVAALGGPWLLKAQARTIVRPVVGVLAGSAFTAELASAMLDWWSGILLVLAYGILTLFTGLVFFRKFGRFDRTTAFFASAPGGLGELSLIGGSLGGDIRRLVVVHSVRVVLTVFLIPIALQLLLDRPIGRTVPTAAVESTLSGIDWALLAACAFGGYGISRFVRFPAGPMLFSMLLSMAVHVSGLTRAVPPPWLVATAQVVLGAVVGARFSGITWHDVRNTAILGAVWAAVLLSTAALLALFGAWLLGFPFETMLLALAPAGVIEMTVISFAISGDVAFVVTCQLSRVLLVLVLTPVVFRLIGVRTGGAAAGRGKGRHETEP